MPASIIVSAVIAIVTTCVVLLINVMAVPKGYGTFAFESIVKVRGFASHAG